MIPFSEIPTPRAPGDTRLPIGEHDVRLDAVATIASPNLGMVLQASFQLESGSSERLHWRWFVGQLAARRDEPHSFRGEYEMARARTFFQILRHAAGYQGSLINFMADPASYRGAALRATVGERVIARTGRPLRGVEWVAEPQTAVQLAIGRVHLGDDLEGAFADAERRAIELAEVGSDDEADDWMRAAAWMRDHLRGAA